MKCHVCGRSRGSLFDFVNCLTATFCLYFACAGCGLVAYVACISYGVPEIASLIVGCIVTIFIWALEVG